MEGKTAALDKVSHTHNVSIEVQGLPSAEAALEFITSLMRLPAEARNSLNVVAGETGYVVDLAPLCCVDEWWGFVWNGVCEWRGDGCPA